MSDEPAASGTTAATAASVPSDLRKETELERYDRNLTELMGELRVALPGVQVLFAFLLVVPFNQRFGSVSQFEKRLYFVTLLVTLLASILLIAPTVLHRLEFQQGEKPYVVRSANRLTIAGLSALAIAMTCAIALITHYLFGPATAAGARVRADLVRATAATPSQRWLRREATGSRQPRGDRTRCGAGRARARAARLSRG